MVTLDGLVGSTAAPYAWDKYVLKSPITIGPAGPIKFLSAKELRGLPLWLLTDGLLDEKSFLLGMMGNGRALVEEEIIYWILRSASYFSALAFYKLLLAYLSQLD